MGIASLLWLVCAGALAAQSGEAAKLTIEAHDKDRRWVLAHTPLKDFAGSMRVTNERGEPLPTQVSDGEIFVLVPFIPAGVKPKLLLREGRCEVMPMVLKDDPAGFISVRGPDREITRYHTGEWAERHKKPFFYPLVGHGANLLRGWPMEQRAGDPIDHPHHTGLFLGFGEVNGRDYWSIHSIKPRRILSQVSGPAFARIVAENCWGEDLTEVREVTVLNTGPDVVMDWTVTLTATAGPVVFAKDLKAAKEGAFAARLAAGLSEIPKREDLSGDGFDLMLDAKGRRGEAAVRAERAPWVDYSGQVEGKKVGIAIMGHPTSFRYPATWHVRAYGLFSSNPWILDGRSELKKGESLTLKYRVYVHGGTPAEGHVSDVFEGFSIWRIAAE